MTNNEDKSSLTSMISIVQSGNASICNANFGFYFKNKPSTEKLLEKIKETRKTMQTVMGNLDQLEKEALQQQAIEHQDALYEMFKNLPDDMKEKLMNS